MTLIIFTIVSMLLLLLVLTLVRSAISAILPHSMATLGANILASRE
jgi:hypothetical protein